MRRTPPRGWATRIACRLTAIDADSRYRSGRSSPPAVDLLGLAKLAKDDHSYYLLIVLSAFAKPTDNGFDAQGRKTSRNYEIKPHGICKEARGWAEIHGESLVAAAGGGE